LIGVKMFDWSSLHLLRQRSTVLDFVGHRRGDRGRPHGKPDRRLRA